MLAAQVLQPLLATRRPERILVLKHAWAGIVPLESVSPVQIIRLNSNSSASGAVLRCRFDALPFEPAVFDLVILNHLLSDGQERVLAETLRVLAPGGDVVLCGLNSTGLRYRFGNRKNHFPGLKIKRVDQVLKAQSFDIKQCLLVGIAGFSRPSPKAVWHGLRLPFADWVVLHGHHRSGLSNINFTRKRHPLMQYAG